MDARGDRWPLRVNHSMRVETHSGTDAELGLEEGKIARRYLAVVDPESRNQGTYRVYGRGVETPARERGSCV